MPATFRYLLLIQLGIALPATHSTTSTSSCSYAVVRLKNPVANHTLISSNTMVLQQYIGLH